MSMKNVEFRIPHLLLLPFNSILAERAVCPGNLPKDGRNLLSIGLKGGLLALCSFSATNEGVGS
jgi:hypothetical protein